MYVLVFFFFHSRRIYLFMFCLSCEHGARFQGNELIVRISSPSRQNIIITIIIRCGADTVVDFPANSPVLLYTRIHLPAVGCFPPRLNAFRKKTSVAVARGGMWCAPPELTKASGGKKWHLSSGMQRIKRDLSSVVLLVVWPRSLCPLLLLSKLILLAVVIYYQQYCRNTKYYY